MTRTPPKFATLALMTAVSVISFNMVAPSLPAIADEFAVSYAMISFAVSGFLAVNAALTLILGPLSDRFGRRPVLLWSVGVFTCASVGAALATDVWVFLTFRTMQAVVAAGFVISNAVVRDTSEPEEAASRLGYLGMAMAVAPMVGPMIGGVLDQTFGWRAIFWAYAAMGVGLWTLCFVDAGETNHSRANTFRAQIRDYPTLLASKAFWAYTLVTACGIGAFYVFISGAPLVSTEVFGLSPAVLGVGLGTITAGFFCGSFVSGRISARVGIPHMILLGRVVPVIGLSLGLMCFAVGITSPVVLFAAAITTGIGNGLTTPSARVGSMSINPKLAGSASGIGGALILAVGAVMTHATGLILTPQNGVWMLMLLMLGLCLAGLALAVWIRTLAR
jgi:Bcr/CflA subfamily drug resistance transporter